MSDSKKVPAWTNEAADGSKLEGNGTGYHVHTYGLGIGHIKSEGKEGSPIITTFNNFNREVDDLLPSGFLKEKE